jgi:hypothetical protein
LVDSLAKKINLELDNIDRLFSESKPLLDVFTLRLPDFIEASAGALTLHSFYNGIENMLLLIAKNYSEVPSGNNWHTQLFEQAFLATEKRTAIFTGGIKTSLKEYLTFRHFIRHAYAYSIDAQRINPLINNAEATWILVKADIIKFLENN